MGRREHNHGVSSAVWGRPSLTRHWSRAQKRPHLPRFRCRARFTARVRLCTSSRL
jgi:hypothetical protein